MVEGTTFWELLEARVALTPDARMLVDQDDRAVTYAEFRDRAEAVAAGLAERGIGAGDVVTWQLPTWIESAVLLAALTRLGATQNPILHIFREREVGFCVRQSGAKLLVVPSSFNGFDFAAMAAGIAADLESSDGRTLDVLLCDRPGSGTGAGNDLPAGDPSTLGPPPTSGDEVRWLFYTSGTTAEPKGAQHTDATLDAAARGMCQHMQIREDDVNGLAFPFPHIAGSIWLLSGFHTGCHNVFLEAFKPDTVVDTLARNDVTFAGSATAFHQVYAAAQRAADHPILPRVREFPGGGSPKPPALHYELKELFPESAGVISGYGLTESPILTMATPDDRDEDLANTEGGPMPGVDLKLVKPDGTLAGVGEEGEIRAKAPQLMVGYLDSTLDAEAFDDEGYFRTGDLGTRNERGMLTITGRLKDIIIRKGENISAKEVEDTLYTHPKVADVAVIGLPDAASGERVCAIVTTAEGQEPITYDEMKSHLVDAGLMIIKVPEQLELVEVIPRNPAGKVLKQDLKKQYEGSSPTRR